MDWKVDENQQLVVVEKTVTDAQMKALETKGRGKMLDPSGDPLLRVEDLKVHFPIRKGVFSRTVGHVKAVDGISFSVWPGQTLGLVGESGCGKTTAGRAILRLLDPRLIQGRVSFEGRDLATLPAGELRRLRQRMQIIFQDPYSSLNPRMTVGDMIAEPMEVHRLVRTKQDRTDRVAKLLTEVGLEPAHMNRYPHEFSGGQRQRISIARALALSPSFIVCDESVSALDVSVQAQVLNLLKDLQEEHGLTYIFISHDLSVVKFMSDVMAVMQDGRIVEMGPAEEIHRSPREEYTRRLIEAIPKSDLAAIRTRRAARLATFAAEEAAAR
jgi:peptide/nickel transport system ATP-binding protein